MRTLIDLEASNLRIKRAIRQNFVENVAYWMSLGRSVDHLISRQANPMFNFNPRRLIKDAAIFLSNQDENHHRDSPR